jgi:hypothetical protein
MRRGDPFSGTQATNTAATSIRHLNALPTTIRGHESAVTRFACHNSAVRFSAGRH